MEDQASEPAAGLRGRNESRTESEAAEMLGISQEFLAKLLEKNEIRFHFEGTRRCVNVRDVLAYKTQRDAKRRRILDELTRAEAVEGLYDREPPVEPAG